jgi:hypothetical protein
MSSEETSEASSDSSTSFWDLVTCAAAYGAHVAVVPSPAAIHSPRGDRAIHCARGKWPTMGRSLFARRIEML